MHPVYMELKRIMAGAWDCKWGDWGKSGVTEGNWGLWGSQRGYLVIQGYTREWRIMVLIEGLLWDINKT